MALPVLVVRAPPMGDLAFHEAAVALLRRFGDPSFAPPGLYALNLGQPNQLFHLLALPLAYAVGAGWACKLLVAASMVAIVTGAGRLAAHLEVTRWAALVVAPLALGWMARWGLVANLLGFGLLLWALPVADRAAREPSPRRALQVTLLTAALYLAHESSMALYALAALLFAVRAPRRPGPVALALFPPFAAAGLALGYHVRSASLKAPSILAVVSADVPVADRIRDLPRSLFSVGRWSPVLLAASLAGLLLLGVASRRREAIPWRFIALGVLSALAFLFVPEALSGSTLVYQRFLPPAYALLALSLLPRGAPPPRTAPLVLLLPAGMLAATAGLFVEADRSGRALDVVLARMDDGAATAQLDLTPRAPSIVAPVVGDAARALALHGGRLLFSFTDAPTYPVTMPAARRWDEPVRRMAMTPFAFAPEYDLTRFRYVLVRSGSERVRAVLPEAFAPEARLVVQSGSWLLFESTLPRVAILAADGEPPTPPPTPLAARVKRLLAARDGEGR